jgi:hypothetical protein
MKKKEIIVSFRGREKKSEKYAIIKELLLQ